MFEHLLLESFIDNSWALIAGISTAAITVSGIAVFWVKKTRDAMANNPFPNSDVDEKIVNVIDKYVLPILGQAKDTAEATLNQEVKAKQFGEILYGMFPEKAAQIKDKTEVKLVNLTSDVNKATGNVVAFDDKLRQLEQLVEEMKSGTSGAPVIR